jgi:hypothetical protein
METIQNGLGNYAKSISSDVLLRRRNGRTPGNFLKAASGDDTLVARELYREAVEFHVLNSLPKLFGRD